MKLCNVAKSFFSVRCDKNARSLSYMRSTTQRQLTSACSRSITDPFYKSGTSQDGGRRHSNIAFSAYTLV